MSLRLSPMVAPFMVDAQGLKKLEEIKGKVNQFGKSVGAGLSSAGRRLSTFVTAPIIGAGIASTKFAIDFNKSMADVGTLIPGQRAKLEGMKKGIQSLAMESGTATDVLAQGLYQTISALGDTAETMGQLKAANDAAAAGGATTKEAIDLLAMVTKNYGDTTASAMTKVSDLSFMTVKLGVTTFPELAASMGSVAGAAKTLGMSQEELFASYATLTGVTGNTSEVSTQLSAILGGMIKPTEGMRKLMKKLGYESAASMVQEEGFSGALQVLQRETGGSVSKLGKLFESKEALRTLLPLMGTLSDQYSQKLAAMGEASGATADAVNEQRNGINKAGHELEKMKQKLVVTGQKIGERLIPVLIRLGEKLIPVLDRISRLSDEQLDFGIKIAAAAAAIGPLLIGLGSLVTAIFKVREGWQLLKTIMAGTKLTTAATDAGKVASGMTQIDAGAKSAAGGVGKLQGALAALVAFEVGRQIGGALSDAIWKIDSKGTEILNKLNRDSMKMQSEDPQQLVKRRDELKRSLESQGKFGNRFLSVAGNMLTLGHGEGEEAYRATAVQLAQVERLIMEKGQAELARLAGAYTPQTYQPNAAAPPMTVDLNLKIDAPNGTKVGANTKGGDLNITRNNGAILPAGAPI